jgi:hypothetical protein
MGRTLRLALIALGLAPLRDLHAQSAAPPAEPTAPVAEQAAAPPAEEPVAASSASLELPSVQFHGFVSQGAFITTTYNYLGQSKHGSVEFTEAALNASTEVSDRLRAGMQLFTRDVGPIGDYKLTLDWAFLDYRWREWIGLRAGRVKMPFGLYNEVNDIPGGRLPILLPQSIYPVTSRDFLLALTGASLYGSQPLGGAGALDYQVFFGTIFLDLSESPQFLGAHTHRAGGAQVFWRTPIDGLRVGPSFLNAKADFDFQLDQMTIDQLVMSGAVPADFDGRAQLRLHDANLLIGSAEYDTGRWLFAAEYSRQLIHAETTPPGLLPDGDGDSDSEHFYALVADRMTDHVTVGGYASFQFNDVDNRSGEGLPVPHSAYQQDYAATGRYDVNEFWLVKLEAHFLRGTAAVSPADNPGGTLDKNWALFLAQTVLSF